MNENGRELIDCETDGLVQGTDLVKRMHREAVERQRLKKEQEIAFMQQYHAQAIESQRLNPAPILCECKPPAIKRSEADEAQPGEPFFRERSVFYREFPRWLAEGHGGKYVLIKGEEILGIFDTWDEAEEAGYGHGLDDEFFVHSIQSEEPALRIRGLNLPWPLRLL